MSLRMGRAAKYGHIPKGGFKIVYADPPWMHRDKARSGKRGAGFKYKLLTVEEICAFPIHRLVADDAALLLWVPAPLLLSHAEPVIAAWGFQYKTIGFNWIKQDTHKPTVFTGMGNWTRANAEYCLICTRGKPKRVSAKVCSVVVAPRGEHSVKPPCVRDYIVKLLGNVPRVELFAREQVMGWHCWGDEVEGLMLPEVTK